MATVTTEQTVPRLKNRYRQEVVSNLTREFAYKNPMQVPRLTKIVLNVSWSATGQLSLGNDFVSFSARFGGVNTAVRVPIQAVLAIYARETGQGTIFSEDDAEPPPSEPSPPSDAPPEPPKPSSPSDERRARFKVVK